MKMMPPDVISHENQLQHLSQPSIFILDVFRTADHAGQIFIPHRPARGEVYFAINNRASSVAACGGRRAIVLTVYFPAFRMGSSGSIDEYHTVSVIRSVAVGRVGTSCRIVTATYSVSVGRTYTSINGFFASRSTVSRYVFVVRLPLG